VRVVAARYAADGTGTPIRIVDTDKDIRITRGQRLERAANMRWKRRPVARLHQGWELACNALYDGSTAGNAGTLVAGV
jgi:hypothetical protein